MAVTSLPKVTDSIRFPQFPPSKDGPPSGLPSMETTPSQIQMDNGVHVNIQPDQDGKISSTGSLEPYINRLVDSWSSEKIAYPETPNSEEGRFRLAQTYRGRAAFAIREKWNVPVFSLGGFNNDPSRWYASVPDGINATKGFDIDPWVDFYLPPKGLPSQDQSPMGVYQILQRTIGVMMSEFQDTFHPDDTFPPDMMVEFDPWDVVTWLPHINDIGVIDEEEYTSLLRELSHHGYIPRNSGEAHATLNFVSRKSNNTSVRAIITNKFDPDLFLLRFFSEDATRERLIDLIEEENLTWCIEISRLLFDPGNFLQSLRIIKPGIKLLKAAAEEEPRGLLFAEAEDATTRLVNFRYLLPATNGTKVAFHF